MSRAYLEVVQVEKEKMSNLFIMSLCVISSTDLSNFRTLVFFFIDIWCDMGVNDVNGPPLRVVHVEREGMSAHLFSVTSRNRSLRGEGVFDFCWTCNISELGKKHCWHELLHL